MRYGIVLGEPTTDVTIAARGRGRRRRPPYIAVAQTSERKNPHQASETDAPLR
jgi:hypothetical protein